MTAFGPSTANGARYPGRVNNSSIPGARGFQAQNTEMWFRMKGNSLKLRYTAGGTDPIFLSVDGGAFATPAGTPFAGAHPTTINLSGELLPGGTADGLHDIRIRIKNGYSGGTSFGVAFSNGVEIVSSSPGTETFGLHSGCGTNGYETLAGTRATTYWRSTFSSSALSGTSSFTSPIFPGATAITGSTEVSRNSYAEFYVNSSTTQMYLHVQNDNGGQDGSFGVWVDRKRVSTQTTPANTFGTFGMYGPVSIPGTGTRLVRVSNLVGLDGVIVNGDFVDTVVTSPNKKVVWVGDSVTAGDSVLVAYDASGNFDQLCEIVQGGFVSYNRGLSGQTASAFNTNSRQNDLPTDANIVVCNMSINDATQAAADPATVTTAYTTMYNAILTRCSSATLLCVPQLPYQSTNRSSIVSVIQAAVSAVANSRCVYVSSDNWVSGLNEGAHPQDLGKAQCCAGGIASIRVTAQPSDGDTVTINGTVFEFDSDASVTGGRTAVTIGAALTDTIENLALAIEADSGTFDLLERLIIPTDATNQGVAIRGCTSLSESGANLTVYGPEAEGWLTMLNSYLLSGNSGRLLLMGVG